MKHLLFACLAVVASGMPAQKLLPGQYLVGTQGWDVWLKPAPAMNTVQMVNPYTGAVTVLTITGVPTGEFASSFLINSSTSFFMGTKQATRAAAVSGNVYWVTLQASGPLKGTWLATRFNKTALPINVGTMVRDNTWIYVCGSGLFAPKATDAQVLRIRLIPSRTIAAGTVFVHSQFGAQFMASGALGSGSAMVLIGTTLHVFTFDTTAVGPGAGINQHWSLSTNPNSPNPTQVGANLPPSNRTNPIRGFGSTEAVIDPRSGNIIVVGRFGELLWRTPGGKDVKQMQWPGELSSEYPEDEYWRGCAINSDTWELALGDHSSASIDVYRDNGPLPTVNNLVSLRQPVAGMMTVAGLAYVPTTNPSVYQPVGTGCKGPSGFGPWSYVNSPPTPGNNTFALTLSTVAKTAALAISTKQAGPVPLPGAPRCLLRVVNPLAFFLVTPIPVRGAATATATIPIAIPASAKGMTVYTQWMVLSPKANALGILLSDARMVRP